MKKKLNVFNGLILAISATELNNTFFKRRRIHVQHGDRWLIPNYEYSVLVDDDSTEEEIYDVFKQFGEIEQVNKRFLEQYQVLVEFKDKISVEKAVQHKEFRNRKIKVSKLIGPLCKLPPPVKNLD